MVRPFQILCALLFLPLMFLSCAPRSGARKVITLDEMLSRGRGEGLDLVNPFAVDAAIATEVEQSVGRGGTPTDRMRRLTHYLNLRGFDYQANRSLTADEAFRLSRGDCMAYTNLYLGLARKLNVPAFFVHISEARNYYEKDGLNFVSSHMAIGCAVQYYTVIVDFTEQRAENTLALYDAMDDATAAGLYYNNVAVDHLLSGDDPYAERVLRYLLKALPHLKEAANNLSVVLMRQGRFDEALDLLQEGIAQHPEYQPFYTNAVQASKGAAKPGLVREFQTQGAKFLRRDPFFMFNEGVAKFQQKDYAGALAEFRRALARQPKSPIILAWTAKAHLTAGGTDAGVKAFVQAEALAPYLPMLGPMRAQFPALAAVPLPPPPETVPGPSKKE